MEIGKRYDNNIVIFKDSICVRDKTNIREILYKSLTKIEVISNCVYFYYPQINKGTSIVFDNRTELTYFIEDIRKLVDCDVDFVYDVLSKKPRCDDPFSESEQTKINELQDFFINRINKIDKKITITIEKGE